MMNKVRMFAVVCAACFMCAACAEDIPEVVTETQEPQKTVIVLDAGHGKTSSQMTDEEKTVQGYEYNDEKCEWGEWRHYKDGTFGADCYGDGCTKLSPDGGSCWYGMGLGDRDTEPQINLNNALSAKKYLEEMGYEVRLTRETDNENPSMNTRVSYCFPDNDTTKEADAALYVCIHSNAGGGRGTSYIALGGEYRQSGIPDNYIEFSNNIGETVNNKIAAAVGLDENPPIQLPYLILFNKSPVPIVYLEIGFYDNTDDLEILNTYSDEIGRAIAEGIREKIL